MVHIEHSDNMGDLREGDCRGETCGLDRSKNIQLKKTDLWTDSEVPAVDLKGNRIPNLN